MKRVFAIIVAAVISAGSLFAQDLASATETYNNGAAALGEKNYTAALSSFQEALKVAEGLGEEGAEIVENCKGIIPDIVFNIARGYVNNKDYVKAIEGLQETVKVAAEYGKESVADKAKDLIPQVYVQQGNALLTAKDYAAAAEAYKATLELTPNNGVAALRLGQALNAAGNAEEAMAAFETAAANGQESTAKAQMANIVLKDASALLKEKKYDEAIEKALKSAEYKESANAYKIAGTAATSLQKKDQAIEYLSKYVELAPTAADVAQIKAAIEALKKQ